MLTQEEYMDVVALRRQGLSIVEIAEQLGYEGLRIQVRKSKTDQQGRGDVIGIMRGRDDRTCPVRAWRAWLAASGIEDGPAFRRRGRNGQVTNHRLSADYVLRIVKERAAAAGHAPELFGGHSLRRGFATTAFRKGVPERRIMDQGPVDHHEVDARLHRGGGAVRRQPLRRAGALRGSSQLRVWVA